MSNAQVTPSLASAPKLGAALIVLLAALFLAACEQFPKHEPIFRGDGPIAARSPTAQAEAERRSDVDVRSSATGSSVAKPLPETGASGQATDPVAFLRAGSDRMVGRVKRADAKAEAGEVTLNFEGTSIQEVVKVILGDLLGFNYRIDPTVQGSVTLQTSQPIARSALLPTLEMLLRSNSAALVERDGLYDVLPQGQAIKGLVVPELSPGGGRIPPGYSVRIVPLRYISAQEMHKILEPFTTPSNVVRVDAPRNLMVLAGSATELNRLIETISVFDVDWMKGSSVALFRPRYVDAKTLKTELERIVDDGGKGPLAGAIRLIEIERLNGLLVITSRRAHLSKVQEWVARLDVDGGGVGRRLFVYRVKNVVAADLATVLNQVFESDAGLPPPEVAPGLEPARVAAEPERPAEDATSTAPIVRRPIGASSVASRREPTRSAEGIELSDSSQIRVIADEANNALLIKATAEEYRVVLAALRELDVVPLQVLVEATIAEITLSGDLEYGLEWFFKNNFGNGRSGNALLDLGVAGLAPIVPGFSYAITDAAGAVRAVLSSLASQSKLNIISSPSLMVLNNQTATINVGDEVPVTTQQQQSTAAESTIVNSIEFRDTGVLLTVTPRVNPGGLVIMEVEQEVSNVAPGTGNSLTPTIQQRQISSTVAVHSGETIVLGGLIRENKSEQQSGIPGLYDLPIVGALFGQHSADEFRTELVVLITPRAVQDAASARFVTEEFRNKMQSLEPFNRPAPDDEGATGQSRKTRG